MTDALERSRVREIVLETCRNRSYRICETILAEIDKLPILDCSDKGHVSADMLTEFINRQTAKLETIPANKAWRNGYAEALKNVSTLVAAARHIADHATEKS